MSAVSSSCFHPVTSIHEKITSAGSFLGKKVEYMHSQASEKIHSAATYAKDQISSAAVTMKELAKKIAAYTILFSGFFVLNLGILASFAVHPIAIPLLVSGGTCIAVYTYMKNHEMGLFSKSKI